MAITVEKLAKGTADRMNRAVEKGGNTSIFVLLIIIALTNDYLDLLVIGSIPILGDIVDIFTWALLTGFLWNVGGHIKWKVRGVIWAASALELIPVVDVIPTFTISVLWAWHKVRQHAEEAEEGIEQISKEGKLDEEKAKKFKK